MIHCSKTINLGVNITGFSPIANEKSRKNKKILRYAAGSDSGEARGESANLYGSVRIGTENKDKRAGQALARDFGKVIFQSSRVISPVPAVSVSPFSPYQFANPDPAAAISFLQFFPLLSIVLS